MRIESSWSDVRKLSLCLPYRVAATLKFFDLRENALDGFVPTTHRCAELEGFLRGWAWRGRWRRQCASCSARNIGSWRSDSQQSEDAAPNPTAIDTRTTAHLSSQLWLGRRPLEARQIDACHPELPKRRSVIQNPIGEQLASDQTPRGCYESAAKAAACLIMMQAKATTCRPASVCA